MNSEMRKKLEEMAEKYGDERAKSFFPVDERAMVGTLAEDSYLSGAEAGFNLTIESVLRVLEGFDCCHPQHRIMKEHILALGEEE